jgi:hypothetical protein
MTLPGDYEPYRAIWVSVGPPVSDSSQNEVCNIEQPASRRPPHPYLNSLKNPLPWDARLPNGMVIEMEDPRCKIAALEAEDPRCKCLLMAW